MCVSMIAKDWQDQFPNRRPNFQFQPQAVPNQGDLQRFLERHDSVSRVEFDALKAELESLKKLLIAAKQYDKETNQPDCEDAEKIALFRGLAKMLGVDLSDVFPAVTHAP